MTRDEEIRRILGIVACPSVYCRDHAVKLGFQTTAAGVDTMPLDVTGRCAFCDTQLVAADPGAQTEPDLCVGCGDIIDRGWKPGLGRRPLYCSDRCRRDRYAASDKSRETLARHHGRRIELQRLRRRRLSNPTTFERAAGQDFDGSRPAAQGGA